jgi:class 3 adenylate cyclase
MESLSFDYLEEERNGEIHIALSQPQFDAFDKSLLWLPQAASGNLGNGKFNALAAIFDLQGFTLFCDVRDPFPTVPDFVDRFLRWFFERLKSQFRKEQSDDRVLLWSYLPVYAKFMGDGVLLLWNIPEDTRVGGALAIGNIIAVLHQTCRFYREEFYQEILEDFTDPPTTLRCGGAFGQVAAIGDHNDYVGFCINVAARLQKLGTLSFAFSRHGCSPRDCFRGEWRRTFAPKTVRIRGSHREERILVDVGEFKNLSLTAKKALFVDSETKNRRKPSRRNTKKR